MCARIPNWQEQKNVLNVFRNKYYLCRVDARNDLPFSDNTLVFYPQNLDGDKDAAIKLVFRESVKTQIAQDEERREKLIKSLTELCQKGLENSFSLVTHRQLPIFNYKRCYFVKFEKLHNIDILIQHYGHEYKILTLDEHFNSTLDLFQESIYKSSSA